MPWSEFSALLAGIGGDTPLGQIVSIRAETDEDRLKAFSPEQRRIRREWRSRRNQKLIDSDPIAAKKQITNLQAALKAAFLTDTRAKKEGGVHE